MLTFAFIWAICLLPLPLILRLLTPACINSNETIYAATFNIFSKFNINNKKPSKIRFSYKLIYMWIIWVLLVIASMQPQWISEAKNTTISGRNIILAIDISGSMSEQDMGSYPQYKDRLTIVKEIIDDFIQLRTHDRLALVLFGSNAYLHVPLTFDHTTLSNLLAETSIGIAGKYTAIGDALGLSVKALSNTKQTQEGLIILLTDGNNNAGQVKPLDIALLSAQLNIKIHTIGIGTVSKLGMFFNPGSNLDTTTLQEIAQVTGGKFFRATDKSSLAHIYQTIDKLEPTPSDDIKYKPTTALYYWPLATALLLMMLYMLWIILRKIIFSLANF